MFGQVAKSFIFGALVIGTHSPAIAQTDGGSQAEFMAVKKGVFSVKLGQSFDLTDRGILLHVNRIVPGSDGRVTEVGFTINGGGGAYSIGVRRNLKAEDQTREFVKDLRMCFLDLVSAMTPKGAAPTATFRLLCQ